MKARAFTLWVAVIMTGVGAAVLFEVKHSRVADLDSSSQLRQGSTKPKPKGFQPVPTQFLSESEWRRLHAVREETLKANPALTAEYQQIQAEMADEQQKWDAAMIKADPSVASIVAKLETTRKQTSAPASASPSPH